MSAPTPAPGDDRPREGYYPDPSIPGYVRYWNGASWVPGTSRPAPRDGEPLNPPPGAAPAAPTPQAPAAPVAPAGPASSAASAASAMEETGPHFFDEDPQPAPSGPQRQAPAAWPADPRVPADAPAQPSGHAMSADGTASIPPAEPDTPDAGGTFIFRRPVPGPAAIQDEGTMTFRPVRDTSGPGTSGARARGARGPASGGSGAPGAAVPGLQGPVGAAPAASTAAPATPSAGPAAPPVAGAGFGAGKAAAARAAAPAPSAPNAAAPAPSVPHQAAAPAPQPAPAPVTSGPGGGQASWAQQVHQLAGAGDEQPVAPWKPPVDDIFQAAARRQAAARPAGLGRRFLARLVDNLVIGAVTGVAAVPFGTRAVDHIQDKIDAAKLSGRSVTVWLLDGTTGTCLAIVLAVLLVFGVLYEVLPTAKWGRTLGKKLCGLDVRDIEGHEPPAFGAALRRWLVYSVPGLLGIGVLGVLWCLFDRPWHQCWHDKAAHTFVAG
ncbi:RDD family protein [Streptomyces sp. NPDC047028]|uniref:RDD family protein n=1 Tax=Streptomyces sp. NPDC047028 TaxID=3155793 RepID=UPI0033E15F6E